ncbi:MAG: Hpt domain-containing protein [Actinomycetota bacterium]
MSARETTNHQDDVLRLFLEEGPDLVASLQDRADFMDLEELKRSAARLRALATVAGASWLAELCRDIDLRARFNELAEIPSLVRRAAIEHAHVRFGIRGGSDGGHAMITPALNGSLA